MADMPSDFWGGWIAVLTVVSLLGLVWLVFSVYFSTSNQAETESPVWDETLTEGSHPAPMWWFWVILSAMVFSVGYLMLYPGLGSYSGMLKWSQAGHLDQRKSDFKQGFSGSRQQVMDASIEDIQADKMIMASAQRVFDQNCSACHGPEGKGQASAFPNLRDADWQWGGGVEEIEQTIRMGRQAVMIGWQPILGDERVSHVTQFVLSLSKGGFSKTGAAGEEVFLQFCVACHGATGTGMTLVGAPNLTDDIFLYGGSETEIRRSISGGRNGVMPGFEQRLDDVQIRMLVAWLTRNGDR